MFILLLSCILYPVHVAYWTVDAYMSLCVNTKMWVPIEYTIRQFFIYICLSLYEFVSFIYSKSCIVIISSRSDRTFLLVVFILSLSLLLSIELLCITNLSLFDIYFHICFTTTLYRVFSFVFFYIQSRAERTVSNIYVIIVTVISYFVFCYCYIININCKKPANLPYFPYISTF